MIVPFFFYAKWESSEVQLQEELTMMTSGSPKWSIINVIRGTAVLFFFSFPFSLKLIADTLEIQLWIFYLCENVWEQNMKLWDLLPLYINNTICGQDETYDLYLAHHVHTNGGKSWDLHPVGFSTSHDLFGH